MKAKKIQIIYLILLLALVIQPACKKTEVDGAITGVTWVLDRVSFSAVSTVQVKVPVTLLLDTDGALFLELDCNFCSGTYELGQDDTFEFLQIGWCTEAYCGPDSPDREIHAALSQVESFEFSGDRLKLFFDDGSGSMEFYAQLYL